MSVGGVVVITLSLKPADLLVIIGFVMANLRKVTGVRSIRVNCRATGGGAIELENIGDMIRSELALAAVAALFNIPSDPFLASAGGVDIGTVTCTLAPLPSTIGDAVKPPFSWAFRAAALPKVLGVNRPAAPSVGTIFRDSDPIGVPGEFGGVVEALE